MKRPIPVPPREDRILWQADLARRYSVNRITVHKWERAGLLPEPDVVIGRRRGRRESTLRDWEAASTGQAA